MKVLSIRDECNVDIFNYFSYFFPPLPFLPRHPSAPVLSPPSAKPSLILSHYSPFPLFSYICLRFPVLLLPSTPLYQPSSPCQPSFNPKHTHQNHPVTHSPHHSSIPFPSPMVQVKVTPPSPPSALTTLKNMASLPFSPSILHLLLPVHQSSTPTFTYTCQSPLHQFVYLPFPS